MAVTPKNYTTGPAVLSDAGALSYEGCVFSPLFATKLTGTVVRDEADRTTKYMEYTIDADGYVTLPTGATDISATVATLRQLLTRQGGALVYRGRGMDLVVNAAGVNVFGVLGPSVTDVAWGPKPELFEFQPLGGGLSAKVKWRVKVHVSEVAAVNPESMPLLQLNYETSVAYSEDGFSSLTVRGTMEIAMTRRPFQRNRNVPRTVDDFRRVLETKILTVEDLARFRVTRREFTVSRDKRIMQWDYQLEEKPYMDLPPLCTKANGSFSCRPAKAGMGLTTWFCTLKATYVVRNDLARRNAWFLFMYLLRLKMLCSQQGLIPPLNGEQNPQRPPAAFNGLQVLRDAAFIPFVALEAGFGHLGPGGQQPRQVPADQGRRAWLIDFSFDEGMYQDSKTVTFSATWRLITIFSHILLGSGLWRKLSEVDDQGRRLWVTTMRDISLSRSWLPNQVDPAADVVVDFGGEP